MSFDITDKGLSKDVRHSGARKPMHPFSKEGTKIHKFCVGHPTQRTGTRHRAAYHLIKLRRISGAGPVFQRVSINSVFNRVSLAMNAIV